LSEMPVVMSFRITRSAAGVRPVKLNQFRPDDKLPAYRYVEFVRLTRFGVGPRKTAANGGIVRLVMQRAASVRVKYAALVPDAGAPFPPTRPVYMSGAVICLDCRCLPFRECRAVRTARGLMRAGKAW